MKRMQPVKQKFFYTLLAFLLFFTTALLIAVSIDCYLIKRKAKQKYLLPYYVTNNKLKDFVLIIYYKNGE